jgi:hypothetical protein
MPSPATIRLVELESPPQKLSEGILTRIISFLLVRATYSVLRTRRMYAQNLVYSEYSRVAVRGNVILYHASAFVGILLFQL